MSPSDSRLVVIPRAAAALRAEVAAMSTEAEREVILAKVLKAR